MREPGEELHHCPTCGGDIKDLGLRDYRWVSKVLPGRVSPSDLDFVLEQASSGRILVMELKPQGAYLPLGQRRLLKRFVTLGCDVWVVWEADNGQTVEVGSMDRSGRVPFVERIPTSAFGKRVRTWWDDGLDEAQAA